jgi:signal transduction histidine kinase
MGRADSAQWYFNQYYQFPEVPWMRGWVYKLAGRIHAKDGNKDSAYVYYKRAINRLDQDVNQRDLAGTYVDLASLYLEQGKTDSALSNAQAGFKIAQGSSFKKEALQAALVLSTLYEGRSIDSAFLYYKLAMGTKDKLYDEEKTKQLLSYKFNEELQLREIARKEEQLRNRARIFTLSGVLGLFIIIAFLLYYNNRQKQKTNNLLASKNLQIEKTLQELKDTQAQLIQSEKMASLGELTAGIAHEIQNPLNFVNNFSETNTELIQEAKDEFQSGNSNEGLALLEDILDNEHKIAHHGRRAENIVKSMLEHSRTSKGEKQLTDINALVDEYLRLAYHGFRAKDKTFNATFENSFDKSIGRTNIVPQDIGRVLLNLFNNAFWVVAEKKKQAGGSYEPVVTVSTRKLDSRVEIEVKDNGTGIPQKAIDKIFQPFFTTKPTGQGTGLGLSLSYDIVKAHGGELKVESTEGEGTVFTILLPLT